MTRYFILFGALPGVSFQAIERIPTNGAWKGIGTVTDPAVAEQLAANKYTELTAEEVEEELKKKAPKPGPWDNFKPISPNPAPRVERPLPSVEVLPAEQIKAAEIKKARKVPIQRRLSQVNVTPEPSKP